MVKSNTRDMRALQRELLKTRRELVQTKQKAMTFTKMVQRARERNIQHFVRLCKKNKNLEQENKILLQSLNNFNAVCNKQKRTIQRQEMGIKKLQIASKELIILKRGLKSIQIRRNPHLTRVAAI
jgi:hypothetical protein